MEITGKLNKPTITQTSQNVEVVIQGKLKRIKSFFSSKSEIYMVMLGSTYLHVY